MSTDVTQVNAYADLGAAWVRHQTAGVHQKHLQFGRHFRLDVDAFLARAAWASLIRVRTEPPSGTVARDSRRARSHQQARRLADVASGRVQIVVVDKQDRPTRSWANAAKLVELFDAHRVSFVSVNRSSAFVTGPRRRFAICATDGRDARGSRR